MTNLTPTIAPPLVPLPEHSSTDFLSNSFVNTSSTLSCPEQPGPATSGHTDEAAHQLNVHGRFALEMTDFALAYSGLLPAGAARVKINESSESAATVS